MLLLICIYCRSVSLISLFLCIIEVNVTKNTLNRYTKKPHYLSGVCMMMEWGRQHLAKLLPRKKISEHSLHQLLDILCRPNFA